MKQVLASFVACSILVHAPAVMAETNSYFYDALGRLVAAQNDRGTTDRDVTTYFLDAAGNRSNVSALSATNQIVPVFRFAKSNGQHFYTVYFPEGYGAGFKMEPTAFSLFRQGGSGLSAIYRCYVPSSDHHFLSAESGCEGNTSEGLVGYVAGAPAAGLTPLYRFYSVSKNDHRITTNYQEGVGNGYVLEGTFGYVPSAPAD